MAILAREAERRVEWMEHHGFDVDVPMSSTGQDRQARSNGSRSSNVIAMAWVTGMNSTGDRAGGQEQPNAIPHWRCWSRTG